MRVGNLLAIPWLILGVASGAASVSPEQALELVTGVIQELDRGAVDALEERLEGSAAAVVTARELRHAWVELESRFGRLQRIGDARVLAIDGALQVRATVHFAGGASDLGLSISESGRLNSLTFAPAAGFASFSPVGSADDGSDRANLEQLIAGRSGLTIQLPDGSWMWDEGEAAGTSEAGEVSFSTRKWMMYLVHWGPIQIERITADYVVQRMSAMWGLEFEFSGAAGFTTIAGHDAVWVEAFGPNRVFYSRFIVWNCHLSGREFIADTNFNLQLRTPWQDFEDQFQSTRTIRCHRDHDGKTWGTFGAGFESSRYRLSFNHPKRWFILDSPFFVPFPEYEGMRDHRTGSLLGLASDRMISFTLLWRPAGNDDGEARAMGFSRSAVRALREAVSSKAELGKIEFQGQERFSIEEIPVDRIWGTFVAEHGSPAPGGATGSGVFQAARWTAPGRDTQVIIILQNHQYRYAGSLSTPNRHVLDQTLRDLVASIR